MPLHSNLNMSWHTANAAFPLTRQYDRVSVFYRNLRARKFLYVDGFLVKWERLGFLHYYEGRPGLQDVLHICGNISIGRKII